MTNMNHEPEQGRELTEAERMSFIEKELRLMRHRIFDVIESSDKIGDTRSVSSLYRLTYALDESISMFHARSVSLVFGED